MATALLVLHLMIATALVAVVLLQRSEGGALGIGGGGGGGFLTGRGTANLLTRTTAGLAAAFFATSILLTLVAQHARADALDLRRRAGRHGAGHDRAGDRTGSRDGPAGRQAAAAAFSTSCSSRRFRRTARADRAIAGHAGAARRRVSC